MDGPVVMSYFDDPTSSAFNPFRAKHLEKGKPDAISKKSEELRKESIKSNINAFILSSTTAKVGKADKAKRKIRKAVEGHGKLESGKRQKESLAKVFRFSFLFRF